MTKLGQDNHYDIVIAGGGTAGLAAALALRSAAPDLAVAVVDIQAIAAKPDDKSGDQRASAIAAAARRMLETLGVWTFVAKDAQPIVSMEVTDSKTGDAVRPVFLTFDGAVEAGEPFAHMVPNNVLLGALATAAKAAGVEMIAPDSVDRFDALPERVDITLGSGRCRRRCAWRSKREFSGSARGNRGSEFAGRR